MAYKLMSNCYLSKLPFELQDYISDLVQKLNYDEVLNNIITINLVRKDIFMESIYCYKIVFRQNRLNLSLYELNLAYIIYYFSKIKTNPYLLRELDTNLYDWQVDIFKTYLETWFLTKYSGEQDLIHKLTWEIYGNVSDETNDIYHNIIQQNRSQQLWNVIVQIVEVIDVLEFPFIKNHYKYSFIVEQLFKFKCDELRSFMKWIKNYGMYSKEILAGTYI